MMNRMPSKQRESGRFLLVIPMLAFLLWACQDDANKVFKDLSKDESNVVEWKEEEIPTVVEMTEAEAKAAGIILPVSLEFQSSPPSAETINKFKDFLKQNPKIKHIISEERDNVFSSVVIELKSGKKETYNFKNKAEFAQFKQQYGDFPVKNLPPPPPPVVLPAKPDHTLFMKRNPQIEMLGWQGENTAVIFLKSGSREEYDLNNKERKLVAEKKYGKLPQAPPTHPDSKL